MPMFQGYRGKIVAIQYKDVRKAAADMIKRSKSIAKAATSHVYLDDAERMWFNAQDVKKGDIDMAGLAWLKEDTAARDEYPDSFLELMYKLGFATKLR